MLEDPRMSYEIAKYQDNIGYAGTIIYRKTGTKPCNACLRNLSAEAGNDATYDKSGIHAYCLFLSVRRRWSAEQPKVESFRVLEFTNGDTYEASLPDIDRAVIEIAVWHYPYRRCTWAGRDIGRSAARKGQAHMLKR